MADAGIGPYLAAVVFHYPADAGQAQAGAGKLGAMQPLKWLEQLVSIGGVEAGAVVGYLRASELGGR